MQFFGLLIGFFAFLIIGLFHPIVVKTEYYFGSRVWPVFLVAGIIFCITSILIESKMISSLFGVVGFTCLWSIRELREQTERVEKGWFPRNPDRKE